MPIYYVQWDVEPAHTPQDPKERTQMWIMMTQWVIADLQAGIMTSWGRCSGETCGYAITSDLTPQELDDALMKYTPAIKFTNRTVLTAKENLATLKKLAQKLPP